MNTSLAKFMSLAFTAVVIVALVWNKLYPLLGTMADKVANFIQ